MSTKSCISSLEPMLPGYLEKTKFNSKVKNICNLKEMGEVDLVELVKKESKKACDELYERYQKKLFIYIFHLVGNKEESEDILQSVFLKTFKNIDRFDTTRKFSSWIYRIAHNEAVNFLKRKSKRYTISWEDVATCKDKMEIATVDKSYADRWMQEELSKEIREAMLKLPVKYQHVLHLRYFKEHSYEDISNILGKPVNTVGTLINRAKKKLFEAVSDIDYVL